MIENILRKIIPRKVLTLIKFYQIFNKKYGHSNTKDGLILNGKGEPLPWITYPAIEFLNTLDLSDCTVFEYGSGSSTIYWASKTKFVRAVERDPNWYHKIKDSLPKNSELFLQEKDREYIDRIKDKDEKYDIIVLDGAVRYPCAQIALDKISERGIILLDNSEWYPNTAKLLRDKGYTQVDFAGFPPLNAFISTTSLFYKSSELLNKKLNLQPIASRKIDAYDDCLFEDISTQFLNV